VESFRTSSIGSGGLMRPDDDMMRLPGGKKSGCEGEVP
jgi:hypothetical protein